MSWMVMSVTRNVDTNTAVAEMVNNKDGRVATLRPWFVGKGILFSKLALFYAIDHALIGIPHYFPSSGIVSFGDCGIATFNQIMDERAHTEALEKAEDLDDQEAWSAATDCHD